jgi:hypothetical protein
MIPTAEEFLKKYSIEEFDEGGYLGIDEKEASKMMIEFAKLHVESFKKKLEWEGLDGISEWGGNPYTGEGSDYLSIDKLNSIYPDSNIK